MGGVSGEHSISLRSAATVIRGLSLAGHHVMTVGIATDGTWLLAGFDDVLRRAPTELLEIDRRAGRPVTLCKDGSRARLVPLDGRPLDPGLREIDAVFPVLHGPGGEDGKIQGLLELAGVPFVGAGCSASAFAMDKLVMKTLCAGAGLPQVEFLSAGSGSTEEIAAAISSRFGYPCFVKPANLGSSVGISRVSGSDELDAALQEARRWDERVIIEQAVDAREIEIAMLGNEDPELSPPGEIIAGDGFYDFATKYVAEGAELVCDAPVTPEELETIHTVARRAWELIGCKGMARADFFIERSTGNVLLNELNTIPGFTELSMYPKLWGAAGVGIAELVDRLVELALDAERKRPS